MIPNELRKKVGKHTHTHTQARSFTHIEKSRVEKKLASLMKRKEHCSYK